MVIFSLPPVLDNLAVGEFNGANILIKKLKKKWIRG
jgi:hypothetical protein